LYKRKESKTPANAIVGCTDVDKFNDDKLQAIVEQGA